MRRFSLRVSEWLHEGDGEGGGRARFEGAEVRLVLVFQANCPGCVALALPALAALHEAELPARLGVLALGTAFEDFELNSLERTRLLVRRRQVAGATLATFERERPDLLAERSVDGTAAALPSLRLPFPVAYDEVVPRDLSPAALAAAAAAETDRLVREHPRLAVSAGVPRAALEARVAQALAQRGPLRARTFEEARLEGTPSWVVYRRGGALLDAWVGHLPPGELRARVSRHLG